MISLSKLITAICSVLLLLIGIDKLYKFMEPECSMMENIDPTLWKTLGLIQILGGILICLPKWRRPVATLFIVLMLFFTFYHLSNQTYDVGGSIFMIFMLGYLIWKPINGNKGQLPKST